MHAIAYQIDGDFRSPLEEWEDEDEGDQEAEEHKITTLTPHEISEARQELRLLQEFRDLALRIKTNSKGTALIKALQLGFAAAGEAQRGIGAIQRKAIIFTESRRTQEYLREILESDEAGFKGKVILFNGTNSDSVSKKIYETWYNRNRGTDKISDSKTADMRAALVEAFKESAEIMIATEAAAEGINLQFCNLVVNYDLPWNPQRVEQRIGRCHRYGQKCDVVVVNFINKKNAADRRVYNLLQSKFQLFQSVFGVSDQILGQIDPSGISFEKQIHQIYQSCRTTSEIETAFLALEKELERQIQQAKSKAREDLMNNFDQSVVEKVRIGTISTLDSISRQLWRLTRHMLAEQAVFDDTEFEFHLPRPLLDAERTPAGRYFLGRCSQQNGYLYRVGHPLALHVIEQGLAAKTPVATVEFAVSTHNSLISAIRPLAGQSGWMEVARVTHTFKDGQFEEHIVAVAEIDGGKILEPGVAGQLFEFSGRMTNENSPNIPAGVRERLSNAIGREASRLENELKQRTQKLLSEEMRKLEAWEEDQTAQIRVTFEELNAKLKEINRLIVLSADFAENLELQEKKLQIQSLLNREETRVRSQCLEVEGKKFNILMQRRGLLISTPATRSQFHIRWNLL